MRKKQPQKLPGRRLPELLAPAGSFEKLVTAIHYGADAVYLGGTRYGLRARAGTFDEEAIRSAVAYAHQRDVKVYVTVNVIAHADDFVGLDEYISFLAEAGVDAVIVADPGILELVRRTAPGLAIHLSTQANVTNAAAARFWAGQRVARLNLARELSLQEISTIRSELEAEIEVFVHGALCISYSGRCMLSQYMTGRDANQGLCAHPCRFSYALLEEKRPGQYFPVEEDERGTYIFNAKDLCLLTRLPELAAAGVDSVKIEGRMKSIFYVGGVVRVYRAALDYLRELPASAWDRPERIEIPPTLADEIARTGTRDLTVNFIDERPGASEMLYRTSRFDQPYEPVAVIRQAGEQPLVEIRNLLLPGEIIEYMDRNLADVQTAVVGIFDEAGRSLDRANPGSIVSLRLAECTGGLEINGMFRRRRGADTAAPAPD